MLFDPLDGSNLTSTSTCVSVQFFSITSAKMQSLNLQILLAGTEQVAAEYVLYGPSTMLARKQVQVLFFTFDPTTQTFLLTTNQVQVLADT